MTSHHRESVQISTLLRHREDPLPKRCPKTHTYNIKTCPSESRWSCHPIEKMRYQTVSINLSLGISMKWSSHREDAISRSTPRSPRLGILPTLSFCSICLVLFIHRRGSVPISPARARTSSDPWRPGRLCLPDLVSYFAVSRCPIPALGSPKLRLLSRGYPDAYRLVDALVMSVQS